MSQTQTETFEVQETILEQLKASRVNGFPFFAYTGIKTFVMAGTSELKLDCPRNPNKITHVWINYNYGTDAYNVTFCRDHNNMNQAANIKEVYCDVLAEVIARGMGV